MLSSDVCVCKEDRVSAIGDRRWSLEGDNQRGVARPGGLIRKCVPQETGIGTRTGCHVKWKPHAKSSPGFCNTKTGARCRQQPAYENRQAAIWKHLRARQRPAKISDIGKPNVPKHSNPEHYGSGLTLDEPLSISGTRVPRAYAAATSPRPFLRLYADL